MQTHRIFDLHCDTLTAFMDAGADMLEGLDDPARREGALAALAARGDGRDTLDDPRHQFSLGQLPGQARWAQCCAVFVPDGLSPQGAAAYYGFHQRSFHRQAERFAHLARPCRTAEEVRRAWEEGKAALILTVENGAALAGSLERAAELARDGVRMLTLTWNGENEIGSGNQTAHGLSPFGRALVPELERLGIVADVSHLNDAGFRDFLDTARRPFAASHSNARAICPHPRNLDDWQIREMVERKCLIGLNYYSRFLREDGREAGFDDLCRHAGHFLELGAADCLALGSDFDGADMPPCLDRCGKVPALLDALAARFGGELAEKIAWRNAMEFFSADG